MFLGSPCSGPRSGGHPRRGSRGATGGSVPGRRARGPRAVDLALGDVGRHLQVDVLARVSGKRDVDWIRHVEQRMIREGVGKVVDARSDRDVRGDRVFGLRTRIAQQPGAPADEQTCPVGRSIPLVDQPDRCQCDPRPAIWHGERHADGVMRGRWAATWLALAAARVPLRHPVRAGSERAIVNRGQPGAGCRAGRARRWCRSSSAQPARRSHAGRSRPAPGRLPGRTTGDGEQGDHDDGCEPGVHVDLFTMEVEARRVG